MPLTISETRYQSIWCRDIETERMQLVEHDDATFYTVDAFS